MDTTQIMGKLSPTITAMIRADHTHVVMQSHKLTPDTGDMVRDGVVRSVCAALEIHAQLEEEIFYPALRQAGVQSPSLDKSVPEHDEMRHLIARVRAGESGPPGSDRAARDNAFRALMKSVMHHVADEEAELLPAAERLMSKERLGELGAKMTRRRLELVKPRAAELATGLAKAAPAKTATLALLATALAATAVVLAVRGTQPPPRWG